MYTLWMDGWLLFSLPILFAEKELDNSFARSIPFYIFASLKPNGCPTRAIVTVKSGC
jgi:hypothetical protein